MSNIRRNVSSKKNVDTVLEFRNGEDAYTQKLLKKGNKTGAEPLLNVDHVVELQLIDYATAPIVQKNVALEKNLAQVVNAVVNLNVTSKMINQSKKGPFTACLNRVKKGVYVDCDELARNGRARWLVENGTWDKIKTETVLSFDAMHDSLSEKVLTRAHAKTLDEATDALRNLLEKNNIYT